MNQARPLFIINPAAGHGCAKRVAPKVSAALRGPAEMVFSTVPGDAEDIAYRGALEGFSPIVGVGGDGTLNQIVNGLMRCPTPPPLGIVPAGSGNDLIRSLGLPTDPGEATRLVWSDASGAIDIGRCNDRYYLNVGGVGLDTKVAMAMNGQAGRLSAGKLPYLIHAVRELSRYSNPEFLIRLDGHPLPSRSLLVAVANGRCYAGGMKICPDADPADGFLDVCVAGDLSRREVLGLVPAIYLGRHGRHRKVSFHKVRSVQIESPVGMEVQLDGEIVSALPAEFRVVPGALRVVGWEPQTIRNPVKREAQSELNPQSQDMKEQV